MADMAKLAYRPIGLVTSLGAAALAGKLVGAVWKKIVHEDEMPGALDREYTIGKVLAAALFQAGVFAVVQSWSTGAAPSCSRESPGPGRATRLRASWLRSC